MAARGIHVPASVDLQGAFTKYVRFRPDGEKRAKKTAWVRLFEFKTASGAVYITGAFGVRGDTYDVEATHTDWSPAERADYLEKRKAAQRAEQAERAQAAESAAQKAARMWKSGRDFGPDMQHPYLETKRVGAFGVRLGFNQQLLVPLRDVVGELKGLQYIGPAGDKIFGTGTAKEGHSHLVGQITDKHPIAFGEGYATCASAHMATGWPVVTCFDAGNLAPVMAAYRRLYPDHPMLVLADDDRHLLQRLSERLAKLSIVCTPADLRESMSRQWQIPDGPSVELEAGWKGDGAGVMRIEGTLTVDGQEQALLIENAGQAKAHAAAKKHKAKVLTPFFVDRESKHTDWNDLHVSAGLDSVREQLLTGLDAPPEKPQAVARKEEAKGKGKGPSAPRDDGPPFLERYTLIYGTTTVWDDHEKVIIRLESLKVAYGKLVDWWLQHEDRRMVPERNVVFDPTGRARPPEFVNLFDRLPIEPMPYAESKCSAILGHLWNLCDDNAELCHWLTAWLAYPLQRPGAKMRTALVLHGRTEGTGKSKLGEIMRRIYGRYCTSVGQAELQRDFNDWISAKLFIIAEEVVSRQDRAHHQGMLQALITQPTVQINTKNMPIREEANHANFMFLSNSQIPMLLNPRDRRYTVVRVERQHPAAYFQAIDAELDNGGAEAFLDYLLRYDLKGFNEFTRPYENKDRMHLITLGMQVDQRFFAYWHKGHAGVPFCCCPASDLYEAFKAWCRLNGERYVPNGTAFGRTMAEELERLGAPPKATKRYLGYSDKQIADADFKDDPQKRQGVVYLVPPEHELRRARVLDDEAPAEPPPDEPLPELADMAYVNGCIKRFQVGLAELRASARRGM